MNNNEDYAIYNGFVANPTTPKQDSVIERSFYHNYLLTTLIALASSIKAYLDTDEYKKENLLIYFNPLNIISDINIWEDDYLYNRANIIQPSFVEGYFNASIQTI